MTKDEMIGIGRRLRNARESKGLSQDEMANELGISLRNYDRIEHGESRMKSQHLIKIKSLTGIGIDYLVTGEIPSNMDMDLPIFTKLNCLPPAKRKKMIEILELTMDILSDTSR